MNLTEMMREGSLQDLRWTKTGLLDPGQITFDPEAEGVKNPNNTKPELEIEWGYGDISPDFSEPAAGVVKRNIPKEDQFDAGPVILFARDRMNAGCSKLEVLAALRAKFAASQLHLAKDGIAKQLRLDGVVGRFAVDSRGYKDCKTAMKVASASPYRRFLRYVIGCSCGDPHMLPSSGSGRTAECQSSGNGMDDFIASDDHHSPNLTAHCRSTMLPIFAGDISDEWVDSTLIDLSEVVQLPEDNVKYLRKSSMSPTSKLAAAFRLVDRRREGIAAQKYAKKVDASEFVLDVVGDVDVDKEVVRQKQLDIRETASLLDSISVAPVPESVYLENPQKVLDLVSVDDVEEDVTPDIPFVLDEVAVGDAAPKDIWVEVSDAGDIRLEPEEDVVGDLYLEEVGKPIDIEFFEMGPGSMDIDPSAFQEEEFLGTDEVELEDVETPLGPLDVEANGDFSW